MKLLKFKHVAFVLIILSLFVNIANFTLGVNADRTNTSLNENLISTLSYNSAETIQQFLNQNNSPLKSYTEGIDGATYSAAEIISDMVDNEEWSINSRIVLAYLELHWNLITSASLSTQQIDETVVIDPSIEHKFFTQIDLFVSSLGNNLKIFDSKTLALESTLSQYNISNKTIQDFDSKYQSLYSSNFTAQALSAPDWTPFLRRPLDSFFPINSFLDHDSTSGSITRMDGRQLVVTDAGKGYNWYDGHDGIDYGDTGSNTSIKAAASGKISAAGWETYPYSCSVLGIKVVSNRIEIQHPNGFKSYYYHISSVANNPSTGAPWKAGDSVNIGDEIAITGSTGCSTKAHLHFSLKRIDTGSRVDPYGYWGSNKQQPLYKTPSSLIVKENGTNDENINSNGFQRYYIGNWVTDTTTGQDGNALYTKTIPSPDYHNWGQWWVDVPTTGSYEVQAFIPQPAEANSSVYKVMNNDNINEVMINQSANKNTWVSLGTYNFNAHGKAGVILTDETTGVLDAKLYFDTIRWVPKFGCQNPLINITFSTGTTNCSSTSLYTVSNVTVLPGATLNISSSTRIEINPNFSADLGSEVILEIK